MKRSEFKDIVTSAHAEYFPKANRGTVSSFVAVLIDELEGSDVELEDDEFETESLEDPEES